jgi:hypothetical protein
MSPTKKPSQAEVAKAAGVSMKSLRNWRDREGLDISNLDAVLHRAGKHPSTAGGESWSEARRRKAIADANRAEILARREAGAVVSKAEVEALFAALGSELRARLLAWRGALVPELHGASEARIHQVLTDRIHELLDGIFSNSPTPQP